MSRKKKMFFKQETTIDSCYYLNMVAANVDKIVLTNNPSWSGVFDFEFKFELDLTGWHALYGIQITTSRILVSESNAYLYIQVAGTAALTYNYNFLVGTEYVVRVRRDALNDIYVSINGVEGFAGNRVGTMGLNATTTYLAWAHNVFRFDGKYFYGNLGGDYNFQLNEGIGTLLTSTEGETANFNSSSGLNPWVLCP